MLIANGVLWLALVVFFWFLSFACFVSYEKKTQKDGCFCFVMSIPILVWGILCLCMA